MRYRPLRGADDYRRFAGRRAKVVLSAPIERQTAFTGHLRGVDGDEVLFESEGGRLVRMPIGQIGPGPGLPRPTVFVSGGPDAMAVTLCVKPEPR